MRPPRAAFQEIGLLQPRGPTAPAECYDTCNNANIEAQSVGKNPALCSPDSAFMSYYKACRTCVEANVSEGQTTDHLEPQFAQWVDYCEASSPIPAGSTSLGEITPFITIVYTTTINGTETSWYLLKTVPAFSARPDTAIITILYTTIIDGSETVWPLLKTLTTFSARPDTAIITIKTSHDGHPTTWTFTTTYTRLHSDLLVSKVTNTPTSNAQQGTPIPIPHPPEGTYLRIQLTT
ncbi:hypothetical protein NUW58_g4945 [Xylaria curta]|uniref:Uncharacterized protein n=1 Tax=Xylaria curta TaxID=42375 RepID=A0ACC1P4K7_9PEZI|nr:hypothetical protein NUW58_g4945 [Xylaria curta]